jgi:hypothetical protein
VSPPAPPPPLVTVGVLRPGMRLRARTTQSMATVAMLGPDRIAARTLPGQTFNALLMTPIEDLAGHTRVPVGALVEGRIDELSSGAGVRPPRIELSVERLCGRPLHARVLDPPLESFPRERDQNAIRGGTFAWLFIGGVAFGLPGLMLGSMVGGSTGAVHLATAPSVEGWMSAGTVLTLEVAETTKIVSRCAV